MIHYKAIVIDNKDNKPKIIEGYANTKLEFIRNLRKNNYKVNFRKVKKYEVFEWITQNTNCNDLDWYINKIPN